VSVPAGPYLPTSALVVVAWLSQRVPGLTAAMVATTLPRDLTTWSDNGFVQVTTIPGPAEVDIPVRHAVAQLDFWGVNVATDGSAQSRPAVNKATRLAELVMRATEDDIQVFGRAVEMPTNYIAARVQAAYPLSDPSPIPDDPSGYGRVSFDLALDWARL
jgi:hypothetical protein